MKDSVSIRYATSADVRTLVDFRIAMFRDMGWTDEVRLAELAPRYAEYVRDASSRGDFVAWIAEKDGRAVGGAAVLWERVPPTVRNLNGRQAYVLSVYVQPESRRRGIAHALLDVAVSYAKDHGAEVISLHCSPEGQTLYERYGFRASPEMRLFTEPASAAWTPRATGRTAAEDAD